MNKSAKAAFAAGLIICLCYALCETLGFRSDMQVLSGMQQSETGPLKAALFFISWIAAWVFCVPLLLFGTWELFQGKKDVTKSTQDEV